MFTCFRCKRVKSLTATRALFAIITARRNVICHGCTNHKS